MTVAVTGVAHIGIRVHDLDRARAFYELLGFEFVVGPVGPEPVAILTHPSGVEINLILNAAAADTENILMDVGTKHPGYTHVALSVKDVEAAMATLEAAGFPSVFNVTAGFEGDLDINGHRHGGWKDHLPWRQS